MSKARTIRAIGEVEINYEDRALFLVKLDGTFEGSGFVSFFDGPCYGVCECTKGNLIEGDEDDCLFNARIPTWHHEPTKAEIACEIVKAYSGCKVTIYAD